MARYYSVDSSNSGENVPEGGVNIEAGEAISVVGSGSITAVIERQYISGWQQVPSDSGMSEINGAKEVLVERPGVYRLAISSVSGNWDFQVI